MNNENQRSKYRKGDDETRARLLIAALERGGWGYFWTYYGLDRKRGKK